MYPFFELFGRTIGVYAICAIIGISASVIFFTRQSKKVGVPFDDVIIMALVVALGLLIGGHILYGLTHISDIVVILKNINKLSLSQSLSLLVHCFEGNVFYGGFFGACIAGVIYLNKKHFTINKQSYLADIFACCIPLFHTFGRIGCFFGGCCYGIPSSFGFTVHGNTLNPDINDINRFPVALIEAGCNLVLFLILFLVFKRGLLRGHLIFVYGLSYSVIRFTLEFFRGDAIRGIWFGLSTSQWISMALFVVSAISLIRFTIKNKNKQ